MSELVVEKRVIARTDRAKDEKYRRVWYEREQFGDAWYVSVLVKGRNVALPLSFQEQCDAEAAKGALEHAGLDTADKLNEFSKDDGGERIRRMMLESLMW